MGKPSSGQVPDLASRTSHPDNSNVR